MLQLPTGTVASPLARPVPQLLHPAEPWLLAAVGIGLPLILRQPQWLVGSAVNFALVAGALSLPAWSRLLPLVVLPAMAATLGGALFGAQPALGLLLLWPVIWCGNAALAAALRSTTGQVSPLAALLIGVAFKGCVILAGTLVLVRANLLPPVFVQVFAPLQIATGLAGGGAALGLRALFPLNGRTEK